LTELLKVLRQAAALYEELARARSVTTTAPGRDEHLAALAAEHRADTADEAGRLAVRQREARRLEGELRDLEVRLQERIARRAVVQDQHAAQALAHELEHLQTQRDALETRIFQAWEATDTETAHLATAEVCTGESVARIAEERGDLAVREQKAVAALAEVETELHDLLAGLPVRVTAKLGRLSARYGNPVAGLAAGGCDACGQMLPQQQAIDADHDRALPTCTGCGRFIVARRGVRSGEWM
jgi:predicted  nucleic acid-binding Zn-ribbon protein